MNDATKCVNWNVIVMLMKMETRKMDLKTKFATVFLALVAISIVISVITIFIIEPASMLPVAFVGFFLLLIWAGATVSDYYYDER